MLVFLLILFTTNVFVESFNDDFLFKSESTENPTTTILPTPEFMKTITRSPQILLNDPNKCRLIPEYLTFRHTIWNNLNNYRFNLQKQFDDYIKNLNQQLNSYCNLL